MLPASTRVLRLLALLQSRREWSGQALSLQLEVDVRTLRRDMNRLRELGYVIEASSGPGGGYRLGAGSATPPLLFDDREAIAVALALSAAGSSMANFQEVALSALAKIDQLLPLRLRRQLGALQQVTLSVGSASAGVAPSTLATLASACRDQVRVGFRYADARHALMAREVEPLSLIHTGRMWYLMAWDVTREDWRTFRVDRIDTQKALIRGLHFAPRKPPEDLATFFSRSVAAAPYRYQIRVRLGASKQTMERRIPPWVGLLEPVNAKTCLLTIGADSIEGVTALMVHTGVDFTLLEPRGLAKPIRVVAQRLLRGVRLKARRRAS